MKKILGDTGDSGLGQASVVCNCSISSGHEGKWESMETIPGTGTSESKEYVSRAAGLKGARLVHLSHLTASSC